MTLAEGGIDLFIPETYDIVWSLIILVIVAVFFYKFFMPKFNAIFDERAAKIQGNIAKAEQAKKDADEAKAKYEAQLSTARVDAAKIRDDARAEASHIIADARSRAESDAAQIAYIRRNTHYFTEGVLYTYGIFADIMALGMLCFYILL